MSEQEFAAYFDKYVDQIFRFCLSKTSNREEAQDITQQVFMRAWQHVSVGGVLSSPQAFLYKIARNLIIDYYRKDKVDSLEQLAETGFDPIDPRSHTILDELDFARAIACINTLDELYREPVYLRLAEGLGPGKIAELLGESENTISVRINRGIKQLRERLM